MDECVCQRLATEPLWSCCIPELFHSAGGRGEIAGNGRKLWSYVHATDIERVPIAYPGQIGSELHPSVNLDFLAHISSPDVLM